MDDYLKGIEEKYPVVGMNIEVAANVKGNGYRTSYYFVTTGFRSLLEMYLDNPAITKEELRTFLDEDDYDYSKINGIPIRFHLEEEGVEPDEEVYDEIYAELEAMENVPGGQYYFMLNDNNIDRSRAIGEKDNTIDKTKPSGSGIMKD